MATIQQIADAAGVSRGTVDRALNHRGRINQETAELVFRIAHEMGYIPRKRRSKAGRAPLKIGVITQLTRSLFLQEIQRGIRQAREELGQWGAELLIRENSALDEEWEINTIDHLVQEGIQGLALIPVESDRVREKINWLAEKKDIPTVTFNSDIVGTRRICFVGMDNQRGGQTAAGLMGMLTGGEGKVLIITGFFNNPSNNCRVNGILNELRLSYPRMEVIGVQGSFDEEAEVERIVCQTLALTPDLAGILIVCGGQAGISRAFSSLSLSRRPRVILFDQTAVNEQALIQGDADFLLDQNGYLQGYRPPYLLAQLLTSGQAPKEEFLYTGIHIKTRYNL